MQPQAKAAALQSIIDLMDGLMLDKAKGRRKQAPAVVEMTVEAEPKDAGAAEKPAEEDMGDEDARALADLYGKDDAKAC